MKTAIYLIAIYFAQVSFGVTATAQQIEFHFIYVGQGDCTLVKTPDGRNVLVDCGSTRDGDVDSIRTHLRHALRTSTTIDVLVVTHPDADHYNFIEQVVQGLTISRVLYVSSMADHAHANFASWLQNHPDRHRLTVGDVSAPGDPSDFFGAGETTFHILAADTQGNSNTRSIVLLVSFRDFDVVLTGDATAETEAGILQRYDSSFLDSELLKIGHHGSNTSTRQPWLDAVRPEVAVVSAAFDSQYQHPRQKVIRLVEPFTETAQSHRFRWGVATQDGMRLRNVNDYQEAIFSTATNGHVLVRSNGGTYEIVPDVQIPNEFVFNAVARAANAPLMEAWNERFDRAFSTDSEIETTTASLATTPSAPTPLPVELGTQVELMGREGTLATGQLAQSETPGWIRLETEQAASVFVRESEVIIVKQVQ